MKKRVWFLAAMALMVAAAFAAKKKGALPEFDGEGKEYAAVFSAKDLRNWYKLSSGSGKAYLDFINKTNESDIPLRIFRRRATEQKWQYFGDIKLGGPCGITQYDNKYFGVMESHFDYWAIVPQNKKKYLILSASEFEPGLVGKNFLIFYVLPENPEADMSYKKDAVIIDAAELENVKNFSGDVKVINKTGDEGFEVRLYGLNEGFNPDLPLSGTTHTTLEAMNEYKKVTGNTAYFSPLYGINVKSDAWNCIGAAKAVETKKGYIEPQAHFYKPSRFFYTKQTLT